MDEKTLNEMAAEIRDIKAILVLMASKQGITSDDIAKPLGTSGSTVRKILAGIGRKK